MSHSAVFDTVTYGTLPAAARRFGIGLKRMHLAAEAGEFPVYKIPPCRRADDPEPDELPSPTDALGRKRRAWRHVKFDEIEDWIRGHRVVLGSAEEAIGKKLAEEVRGRIARTA